MDIIYRYNPHAPLEVQQPKTNREALKKMAQGNQRFASLVEYLQERTRGGPVAEPIVVEVNPISLGVPLISGLAPEQAPFAMVLGCSDARVPIEHVLDCSANDLFVVRVAGNVLGLECLGSIDYAACNLRSSLRSVVVLGHTGCGAVSAAVDVYLSPENFADITITHAVRTLIDRIMLAVRGSDRALQHAFGAKIKSSKHYRDWLITSSIYANAAVTAYDLQREVNNMTEGLHVSYSVYDVAMARVAALPLVTKSDIDDTPPFLPAPKTTNDFAELAQKVVERLARAKSTKRQK